MIGTCGKTLKVLSLPLRTANCLSSGRIRSISLYHILAVGSSIHLSNIHLLDSDKSFPKKFELSFLWVLCPLINIKKKKGWMSVCIPMED